MYEPSFTKNIFSFCSDNLETHLVDLVQVSFHSEREQSCYKTLQYIYKFTFLKGIIYFILK